MFSRSYLLAQPLHLSRFSPGSLFLFRFLVEKTNTSGAPPASLNTRPYLLCSFERGKGKDSLSPRRIGERPLPRFPRPSYTGWQRRRVPLGARAISGLIESPRQLFTTLSGKSEKLPGPQLLSFHPFFFFLLFFSSWLVLHIFVCFGRRTGVRARCPRCARSEGIALRAPPSDEIFRETSPPVVRLRGSVVVPVATRCVELVTVSSTSGLWRLYFLSGVHVAGGRHFPLFPLEVSPAHDV